MKYLFLVLTSSFLASCGNIGEQTSSAKGIEINQNSSLMDKHIALANKNENKLLGLTFAARAQNLIVADNNIDSLLNKMSDIASSRQGAAIAGGVLGSLAAIPSSTLIALGSAWNIFLGTGFTLNATVVGYLFQLKDMGKFETFNEELNKAMKLQASEVLSLKNDVVKAQSLPEKTREEMFGAINAYVIELLGKDLKSVNKPDEVGYFYFLKSLQK